MINFQAHPRLAVLPAACLAVTLTFAGTGCSNIHDDSTRTKSQMAVKEVTVTDGMTSDSPEVNPESWTQLKGS